MTAAPLTPEARQALDAAILALAQLSGLLANAQRLHRTAQHAVHSLEGALDQPTDRKGSGR